MRNLLFVFLICIVCNACQDTSSTKSYDPNEVMTKEQQDSLAYALSRYMGKLPRHANHTNKFDSKFDSAYLQIAQKHILLALYKRDNLLFFMYARIAPSLVEKYVAVAGKVEVVNGDMISYEEGFRTWKKPMEELKPLSLKLFNEMIQGKDLSPYYPENSGDDYIIEFPSKEVYFDKTSRTWKRKGSTDSTTTVEEE